MAAFTPVSADWSSRPCFADERVAWEGQLPELPDQPFRVEAAGFAGKPVYFVIAGPWSRVVARAPPSRRRSSTTIIVEPRSAGHAGADARRRGARAAQRQARTRRPPGRVPRRRVRVRRRSWSAWLLGRPRDAARRRHRTGCSTPWARRCSSAAVLWLTYLGLEPYIRRYSPDSLIGWTRLLAGTLARSAGRRATS